MKTLKDALICSMLFCVACVVSCVAGCAALRDPQVANPVASFCESQLCEVKQIQDESTKLGIDCQPYARAVCTIGVVLAPFAADAIAKKQVTEQDLGKARDAAWSALQQLRTASNKAP
jgi:hypothetical protein